MTSPPDLPPKLHPTVLDTSAVQIARVYAQALYGAAAKAHLVEALLQEYESLVHDVMDESPAFERVLHSTIIGRADKTATLRRIFEGQASPIFLNYLFVLNDHGRLELLRPVLAQLQAIHDERLGRVPVEVRVAVALDVGQEQALRDRLSRVIDGQPVFHSQVDQSLLGGLIIRVADTVYDGSLRTQLRRLRDRVFERSSHEIQSRRDQFSHTT